MELSYYDSTFLNKHSIKENISTPFDIYSIFVDDNSSLVALQLNVQILVVCHPHIPVPHPHEPLWTPNSTPIFGADLLPCSSMTLDSSGSEWAMKNLNWKCLLFHHLVTFLRTQRKSYEPHKALMRQFYR